MYGLPYYIGRPAINNESVRCVDDVNVIITIERLNMCITS